MNRLIAKMDDGSVLYDVARHRECIERLAAYEDTGLMPDEIVALKADRDAWRRRAECLELDLIKTLRAIPVGMCKQFCKRYRANCGVWGECNPEWRGPEEEKE
jgi:hypothetical protein